ncbi:hypothetical protein EXIGLDRAFT_763595 [Exidia glandulosa HHB12029]|uniref:F-box domain-containing protein n=1 Tax=Exidia glandulosa HHB12029 TaxID=1314781 RepID=A0A165LT25_EXIGL|nr:hypothetical protein EXIGLDRAFT_763595 [Exidia glandulosa HHB12029]
MADGDRESVAALFEELACRLALRALSETGAPSDVAHTLYTIARRGIDKAARSYNSRQIAVLLPAELLGIVFSLLSMVDRLRVLCVCRQWRTVGLADCLLWNHIRIGISRSLRLPFAEWQVQHSGLAPLHIEAYSLDSIDAAYTNLIAGTMSRVEALSISGTAAQLSDLDLARFLAMSPRLESLRYDFGGNNKDPGLSSLLVSSLPHLRNVQLIGTTKQLLVALPALHAVNVVNIERSEFTDDNSPALLPSLLTRDASDLPVNGLIGDFDIRLQLERGTRTLVRPSLADETWLFYESTVFRSLTSLVSVLQTLPNRPFPAAPALRVVFIADDTLSEWRDYGFTWTTPALRTICIGCDLDGIDDRLDESPIDRLELGIVLRNVFAFSAGRRLPILSLRNVLLSDTEVEGQLRVEDLVEAVDVVRDLDWEPCQWAESLASGI